MLELKTERLIITVFTPEMAQAVHENSLDADNRRFLPDEVFETKEDAAETVAYLMAQYGKTDGPLVYPVLLRNGTPIGHVQAVPIEGGGWEIGYHVGQRYTNKGYAAEAVAAFLPAVMERLGIREITGVCAAENAASRRVMEKCGFALQFEGMGAYQGQDRPICRYLYRRG